MEIGCHKLFKNNKGKVTTNNKANENGLISSDVW